MIIKEEGSYENGKKDGKWTEVWSGGGVRYKSEGSYRNGKKDGKWIKLEYNIIGLFNYKSEGTFKNGEEDGKWTEWYDKEGEKKKSEGTFKNGKMDGKWTYWYDNGQKKKEGTLKYGKEDGLWTEWYEKKDDITVSEFFGEIEIDQQMKYEKTYKDGKVIYKKQWNEDGSVKE